MAQVVVEKVNKYYENGFHAVKDADFIAEDKEFVILVGPSGCGKSTTLRMIAGLEDISSGEIKIGDRVVNNIQPKDRDIAMVFQNYALYPHMTVYDNMAFALKLRKIKKDQITKIVTESAKLLGIEELLDRKPKQLSGGQRQRVALGRAIVRQPKVFLFDEPLSNLDAKLRVQMRAEIIKLHKKLDTTMIYVTHDQVEAMTMADKIVVMKDGDIHQIDSPINIYNNPRNLFVAGFIGSPSVNQFNGKIIKNSGKLFFDEGKFTVEIPEDIKIKLTAYENKVIIMGVRPEDIYDSDFDTLAEIPQKIEALCEVVEPMGNEFIVYMTTGNSNITARFDPKKLPPVDEKIKITLDMKKAHFFDPETEETITYQG
ncbi:MAG: sn-glycerol-3-phosphate ABC transporter ATP-binding protein UgpC [Candidatus Cloacimonetes bacterium]|nr:sn-glycerol-3-phosphate ABC transporter ATP-binding protein UgpC [Candidatus Cloacimonadota bacterium]